MTYGDLGETTQGYNPQTVRIMRRFEGIMTKAEEDDYNLMESFTYEEIIDYWKQHPNHIERNGISNIPVIDMTYDEFLKKYDLVDMTDFFKSHGLK